MEKQSGFAEVNRTRLYYEVAGIGDPLVLIHGFAVDNRSWDDQFEVFAQHYRVIRYDRRGFGRSANPTSEKYMHCDDLKGLLGYLGITQASIVGHSDGCPIAVNFALVYPEMTRALIPVSGGPSGFQWPPELDKEISDWFTACRVEAQKSGATAANKLLLQIPISRTSMANPYIAQRFEPIALEYPGWHWFNKDPVIDLDPPAVERLEQISAPTLIVVGEHEYAGNLLGAELLHQHIPNAQKVVVPGAGHIVTMEAAKTFNEIVLRFLAQLNDDSKQMGAD